MGKETLAWNDGGCLTYEAKRTWVFSCELRNGVCRGKNEPFLTLTWTIPGIVLNIFLILKLSIRAYLPDLRIRLTERMMRACGWMTRDFRQRLQAHFTIFFTRMWIYFEKNLPGNTPGKFLLATADSFDAYLHSSGRY